MFIVAAGLDNYSVGGHYCRADYKLSELYREEYTARRPAHIRRLSVP